MNKDLKFIITVVGFILITTPLVTASLSIYQLLAMAAGVAIVSLVISES